jgi:2-polyprenyl-6-methoxyphenol hydroxylase-like FAD-dependent oxidoreductase
MSRQVTSQPRSGRAVVMGASMAGLLAARVLSEVFDEVLVLDRDEAPAGVRARRCAPQGRHVHAFMSRGVQVLEDLCPGLVEQMVDAGGVRADAHRDAVWYANGLPLARGSELGLPVIAASRPFVEAHLRAWVAALPGVRFMPQTAVAGPVASADGTRIAGVRATPRDGGDEQTIDAEMIVDACGRGSRTPEWLTAMGFDPPPAEVMHVGLGYATRTYRVPEAVLAGRKALIIMATPDNPRGGVAQQIEDGLFQVSLGGYGPHRPPTNPEGFVAHAAALPSGDLHHLIRAGEPVDDVVGYRVPTNIRRRYDRLKRFPNGLLVLGDALCAFNPVYAQGMTVAAIEVRELRAALAAGQGDDLWRRFMRRVVPIIDSAWQMAAAGDLRLPCVPGPRPLPVCVVNGWLARLQAAAVDDPVLARLFISVASLVERKERLLAPAVVLRVLAHAWRHAARTREPALRRFGERQ